MKSIAEESPEERAHWERVKSAPSTCTIRGCVCDVYDKERHEIVHQEVNFTRLALERCKVDPQVLIDAAGDDCMKCRRTFGPFDPAAFITGGYGQNVHTVRAVICWECLGEYMKARVEVVRAQEVRATRCPACPSGRQCRQCKALGDAEIAKATGSALETTADASIAPSSDTPH